MPTTDELQRIAAVLHTLRPDWRPGSLVTFLTRHHGGRPYRDLLIAAVVVATDERTKTPELLNQHGPWWVAAQAAFAHVEDHRVTKCPEPGHRSYPRHNCGACRAEQIARTDTTPPAPQAVPVETVSEGAQLVRAAMRQHGITPSERTAR